MAEAIASILLLEPRVVASVPRWSDAMVVAVVNFIGDILSSAAAAGIAVCFFLNTKAGQCRGLTRVCLA